MTGIKLSVAATGAATGKANYRSSNESAKIGLNRRGANVNNVFDCTDHNDDGDDDERHAGSHSPNQKFGRMAVNKAIAEEQLALRKRAEATMKLHEQDGSAIYNYDEVYDSIHTQNSSSQSKNVPGTKKESLYISDLLEASEKRKREHEIIMDRRIVKEQENNVDGTNSEEKYITAGYKRKLQERDLWLEEQRKKDEIEKNNDITKITGAEGQLKIGRFFGNTTMIGGSKTSKISTIVDTLETNRTSRSDIQRNDNEILSSIDKYPNLESSKKDRNIFTEGFTRIDDEVESQEEHSRPNAPISPSTCPTKYKFKPEKYIKREAKVSQARERFFQRWKTAQ